MDNEETEYWRKVRVKGQVHRAKQRKSAPETLDKAGVKYTVKNDGSHLIVQTTTEKLIDFWPSNGYWIVRGETIRRVGIQKLIQYTQGKNHG